MIGLDATRVGLALTIALVLDAISDPIVGYWSDNFRSRWGRRHPFMYASAIPITVSYFLLWSPPTGWSNDALFWYVLTLAILTRTFLTFFETPSAALAPELTRDYDARSSLLSWRSFFGWTGGNAMTVLMFFILFPAFVTATIPNGQFNREAYAVYGWIAAGVIFAAIVVSSLGTHRQIAKLQLPPIRKMSLGIVFREMFETLANRSFFAVFATALFANVAAGLGAALSVYMTTYFWGFRPDQIGFITLAIFISAALGAALAPVVTRRWGKRHAALIIGGVGLVVSPFAILLRLTGVVAPGTDAAYWIVFAQGQIDVVLVVCFQVLIASMIADLVEQSELKTGRRSEGVFFAANTFIQKMTTGLGVMAATLVLALANFPAGATPDQVPQNVLLALGWWYLPAIMGLRLAMLGVIFLYRLDRKDHEENLRKLGERGS